LPESIPLLGLDVDQDGTAVDGDREL